MNNCEHELRIKTFNYSFLRKISLRSFFYSQLKQTTTLLSAQNENCHKFTIFTHEVFNVKK